MKIFALLLDTICVIVIFSLDKTFGKKLDFDPRDLREVIRYFVVGVLVTLGYTFTVIIFVDVLRLASPLMANLIGFILWTPASYFGHKEFTFEYSEESAKSIVKFFVVFCIKLLASIVVIMAAQYLNYSYLLGVIANWFVIPIITFMVLKLWVFVRE